MASSDDVDVAVALIHAGTDTRPRHRRGDRRPPLACTVRYGCWHVAWLLVARGVRIGTMWEAAALGDRPRAGELLATDPPPTAADIYEAFWQACHGGSAGWPSTYRRAASINATSSSTWPLKPVQGARHSATGFPSTAPSEAER